MMKPEGTVEGKIKKILSPIPLNKIISNGKEVDHCRFTIFTSNHGFSNSLIFFCDREGIHFDEYNIDLKNIKSNFHKSLQRTAFFFNKFYDCEI